jgi:ArsR family transcriptional regulator, arsenate/arsenite/antimonite-responsive transcriptional repressor
VTPGHAAGVITSATVERTTVDGPKGRAGDPATAHDARTVAVFRALGDPTRLRVMELLASGQRCACEIQAAVDVSANLLSHHLKVLRTAGLIAGERRGRWIDYRLEPAAVAAAAACIQALVGGETEVGRRAGGRA